MEERMFTVRDPNTFTNFEQICDMIEQGARTERSSTPGSVVVIDSKGDKQNYTKEFNVTREDRDRLTDKIRAFLMRGRRKTEMPVFERQSYRQEGENLFRQICAYAHCLPESAKDSIDAYCDKCQEPRKISISDKETFVHCSDCRDSPFI